MSFLLSVVEFLVLNYKWYIDTTYLSFYSMSQPFRYSTADYDDDEHPLVKIEELRKQKS